MMGSTNALGKNYAAILGGRHAKALQTNKEGHESLGYNS